MSLEACIQNANELDRYSEIQQAVDRLAAYYSSIPGLLATPAEGQEVPPERVIAVLTSTAIDESLLEIALAKLGLTGLLLSVNNSVAAVAHLCKQTSSKHLVYGTKFADAAAEVKQALAKEGYELEVCEVSYLFAFLCPLTGAGRQFQRNASHYGVRRASGQLRLPPILRAWLQSKRTAVHVSYYTHQAPLASQSRSISPIWD